MTTLTWTKDFTSADDGNTIGGADIGNIQDDFKGVINGNLDNANVNASAAVEEYKIRYDLDDGHDHDGVNSRLLPTSGIALPHARSGCAVKRASVSTLTVEPGAINIGGTVFVIETATTLDMTSDFASGSEGSDAWFYIYAKASGTSLAFVLSTSPPSFSDTSSNTTEIPFRYDVYASIDHRLIGAGFNDSSSDIVIDTVHSFDLSPMIMGKVTGGATAADDFTVETGWTPKFIKECLYPCWSPYSGDSLICNSVDQSFIS